MRRTPPSVRPLDLRYRPTRYFGPRRLEAHLLAQIQNARVKEQIQAAYDAGHLEEARDLLQTAVRSPEIMHALESVHPSFLGGNYLPPLEAGEVEIARLTLESVTRDVKVAYAKQVNRRIRIRVVDEYDADYITAAPRVVARPLTLGHFARYFVETIHLYDILEMNFVTYREPGGGDPLESALAFFTAQSDFYPNLDAACRRVVRQRCAHWTAT